MKKCLFHQLVEIFLLIFFPLRYVLSLFIIITFYFFMLCSFPSTVWKSQHLYMMNLWFHVSFRFYHRLSLLRYLQFLDFIDLSIFAAWFLFVNLDIERIYFPMRKANILLKKFYHIYHIIKLRHFFFSTLKLMNISSKIFDKFILVYLENDIFTRAAKYAVIWSVILSTPVPASIAQILFVILTI